ncbi:MAG: ABC transporter ATP-binding protein [Phaeodactylibacter sp.]|nr:ABC transporter ATP-binding protein [Phaeodactylibacter sp.]
MITVTDLSYTYPKSKTPAVRSVSFEIGQGEIFGFLGPSGAGKSTTQKILIQLLKGYKGNAVVLGRELSDWDRSFYNHIGVGFELPNHYLKLTAIENLQLFASFYAGPLRDPMALLEAVGLAQDADKKVSAFSKGMRMRLNFVRALLHDPEILFFDEPTSGLDPVNARKIKQLILEQKAAGKTIFITTHAMQDADELCDRVAFIIDGRIELIDAPKKLKLEHGRRLVKVEYLDGLLKSEEFELEGLGRNPAFLQLLNEQAVQTIHTEEASLEDIFVKVTGRSLQTAQ